MKFKIIMSIIVVALVGALSFMADVAGVNSASQSKSPATQQNSSSSSGRTSGRIGGLN